MEKTKLEDKTRTQRLKDVPPCGLRFGAGLYATDHGVTLLSAKVGAAAADAPDILNAGQVRGLVVLAQMPLALGRGRRLRCPRYALVDSMTPPRIVPHRIRRRQNWTEDVTSRCSLSWPRATRTSYAPLAMLSSRASSDTFSEVRRV